MSARLHSASTDLCHVTCICIVQVLDITRYDAYPPRGAQMEKRGGVGGGHSCIQNPKYDT